jgi:hypothetical protein
MYTGLAVRTALAMGINREPRSNAKKSLALLKAETRTWWYVFLSKLSQVYDQVKSMLILSTRGLYSLETYVHFSDSPTFTALHH